MAARSRPDVLATYADAAIELLVAVHRAGRGEAEEATGTAGDIVARLRAEVQEAREALLESLLDMHSDLGALAANGRLNEVECEVFAFALACELDLRRQRLVGYLQDDAGRTRLTLQTVGWLLGDLGRVPLALGPSARLRRTGLLELDESGPWAQHSVVVPAAVVWAYLGDASLDPELPHGTQLVDAHVEGDGGGGGVDPAVDEVDLAVVFGPDRVRRRQAAMRITRGSGFLVAPAPTDPAGWLALVREGTITGRGVVVEVDGSLSLEGRRWIERADHLPWAICSASELPISELPDRPFLEVEASSAAVSEEEWADAFGEGAPHMHRLSAQQVEQVSRVHAAQGGDIDRAVRRLLAGPLETQAQRIRPRHSWNDLVLDPKSVGQLREIVDRYRLASHVYDRWGFSAVASRGLVSLFSGPSGTGKTLAAEIVASELGLDMFKLDLSAVVSKYIGETEKNLDKVFDAAGMGNVVLFFDEADSMFGKRSEVKDAHDRYANLEVSYLLQRIESFDGVVVLATNFEKSIDDAFLRRIHARIAFTPPAREEREAIWRRHLPERAPVDGVDLEWLAAAFELTGGQIRNAAVHAAFLAAAADRSISMIDLVRGVAQEIRKVGRLLRPEDFGTWYSVIAGG